ncbi:hypothetical protein WJX73_000784 [Symbiochloris irregularis]|uniref:Helicase C-terminal domain-containing protein n=1 Tax=Symbiochloris irregularis TaxID=706552 RepID=A0AAW1PQ52_9CHLO
MQLVEEVLTELSAPGTHATSNPVQFQQVLVARQQAEEQRRKEAKAARDKKVKKGKQADDDQEDSAVAAELQDPVPKFSFRGRVQYYDQQQIEELVWQACRGMDAHHPLVRAMRRGIGVHHGGLPTRYRQNVEILFRCRYLQCIIATGTLAYGINAPCRTVVFAGDHFWLNPLQYRQMTGRAGRRGFDTLGHVVLFGVSKHKAASLMVSPVPRLFGHFPLSISLLLRALQLQACNPEDSRVRDTLLCLFQRPFYTMSHPEAAQKMPHLCRFALEYLMRMRLLDDQGRPLGLAGIVEHLFWTEPSNLLMASFLQAGTFFDICSGDDRGVAWTVTSEKLLILLSHIFQRVQLHDSILRQPDHIKYNTTSKVILEPLTDEQAAVLEQHNATALHIFTQYVHCYVRSTVRSLEHACCLPMSGLKAGRQASDSNSADGGESSFMELLEANRVDFEVCSPFAALSGIGDKFDTVADLVLSVPPDVLLDKGMVPAMGMVNRKGRPFVLNRYILDYWKHGSKHALEKGNRIPQGSAWEACTTFTKILQALATSYEHLPPEPDNDCVVRCFRRLAQEYWEKMQVFNGPRKLLHNAKGGV